MVEKIDVVSTLHFDKAFQKKFDSLIGLDQEKESLLFGLKIILDENGIASWKKKHHKDGLPFLERIKSRSPAIILSGDVGCGKTELALSVASPLSTLMGGQTIKVFETPTDIRAGGYVGDISKRIVETFKDAKSKLTSREFGILIIDEADDLATSREQMQAHHEDRAGVNVLIKELDSLERNNGKMAVILITNRGGSIDPAIKRRASLQIQFERPNPETITLLLKGILDGIKYTDLELQSLVKQCIEKQPAFTFSDIIRRIGENALVKSIKSDSPLSIETIRSVIEKTKPSPEFKQHE
ncbi:MAG: ATP-binding protein [Imperialibacter sp.]|uniref:ATP-binding protein n=1 Tax=Imperialibacter sp. TaxID=2038411 RepID=UPI0032EEBDF3